MRTKVLTFALLAGTVVGCASNPPPPPPMAAAPPPPPPAQPIPTGPMAGLYRGQPSLQAESTGRCTRYTKPLAVRVLNNNTFTIMGMRATVGPDGSVTGRNITGKAENGIINVTATRGTCVYATELTKA
jgi:hypothetical protein